MFDTKYAYTLDWSFDADCTGFVQPCYQADLKETGVGNDVSLAITSSRPPTTVAKAVKDEAAHDWVTELVAEASRASTDTYKDANTQPGKHAGNSYHSLFGSTTLGAIFNAENIDCSVWSIFYDYEREDCGSRTTSCNTPRTELSDMSIEDTWAISCEDMAEDVGQEGDDEESLLSDCFSDSLSDCSDDDLFP